MTSELAAQLKPGSRVFVVRWDDCDPVVKSVTLFGPSSHTRGLWRVNADGINPFDAIDLPAHELHATEAEARIELHRQIRGRIKDLKMMLGRLEYGTETPTEEPHQ